MIVNLNLYKYNKRVSSQILPDWESIKTCNEWMFNEQDFISLGFAREISPRKFCLGRRRLTCQDPNPRSGTARRSAFGPFRACKQRWGANMLSPVLNIWPGWNLRRAAQLNRRPSGWERKRGEEGGGGGGGGGRLGCTCLATCPGPIDQTAELAREEGREGGKEKVQEMDGAPAFCTLEHNNLLS